jgi:hypothetical protein
VDRAGARIVVAAALSLCGLASIACASTTRSSVERFKLVCASGQQRVATVINSSSVLADVFGARLGGRDRPTYLGSVSPGRRGEFIVGDSVMVSTQDPSSNVRVGDAVQQPPGVAMRFEYECR